LIIATTAHAQASRPGIVGDFQHALGCSSDWDPACPATHMKDQPDGGGSWYYVTDAVPAGSYQWKIAVNDSWTENYGAGGSAGGPNLQLTVPNAGHPAEIFFFPYHQPLSDGGTSGAGSPIVYVQTDFNVPAVTGIVPARGSVGGGDTVVVVGATIESSPGPWETPQTELARLALLGARQVNNGALNVFVVDRLPAGIDGVSLGAPGPPLPSSYYFGVAIRREEAAAAGWVLAHELAHFLGLRHVRELSPGGVELLDPIDDTEPGRGNLMERGRQLTPGQVEVLLRSPLLRADESSRAPPANQ